MSINIFKAARPSEGAVNLKKALSEAGVTARILKSEGSAYRGSARKKAMLINWGQHCEEATRLFNIPSSVVLNNPAAVKIASNKLASFNAFFRLGIPIVPYFTVFTDAVSYVVASGGRIFVRTTLSGHSGEGIIILVRHDDPAIRDARNENCPYPIYVINQEGQIENAGEDLDRIVNARLFTIGYIGKRSEWRVHVVNGEAILIAKKVRSREGNEREDVAGRTSLVRNTSTGWVYSVVENNWGADAAILTHLKASLSYVATQAVAALGLDFGAVDLIQCTANDIFTLEVNTAPGLEEGSTSLAKYCEAFLAMYESA